MSVVELKMFTVLYKHQAELDSSEVEPTRQARIVATNEEDARERFHVRFNRGLPIIIEVEESLTKEL